MEYKEAITKAADILNKKVVTTEKHNYFELAESLAIIFNKPKMEVLDDLLQATK